jgi:hypothetical protein
MAQFPHRLACSLALGLALVALPVAAVKPDGSKPQARMPGEIIVKFRDDAGLAERDAQMLRVGAEPVGRFGRGRNTLLRIGNDRDVEATIARLKASGLVEYAHPNHIRSKRALCTTLAVPHACPNDTTFNSQYHLHNPFLAQAGGESDADMDMPEAWDLITSSSVLLAIIDDGFDLDHPDLDANLQSGLSCNQANASCNGNADAQSGQEAHGTYVAGSAAAVGNNGTGVAGVMWSGNVFPLRMPNYSTAETIMAVDEAIAQGARVINMSFGGVGFDQGEVDAIDRARTAGILVVASAGNEDSSIDKSVTNYPANYPLDNILSIAASDAADGLANFSNWGPFTVDLAAGGDGIFTTELGGGIAPADGTSFSSPITAGAAALIGQHLINNGNTTWDYRELKARLLAGAENSSDNGEMPLRGRVAGGRVNVFKSLGPIAGGVLVVNGISFDDSTGIDAGNDNDGQPDPGETFDIIVTIENAWQAAGTVAGTLSTVDADATVTIASDTFPSVAAFGTSTAEFRVTLGSFTGNEQILFKLDLVPQTGAAQSRYFYLEVGELRNGVEISEPIQTNTWDEFHAWHASVPAGATNIVFETHSNNSIDIDFFGRRNTPPTYFADLATHGTAETCDAGDPCLSSNGPTGEETLTTTQTGLWHLVVINAAHTAHTYRIKASWDAAGAGTMRFTGATTATTEAAGTANIQVVRSGGVGAVSVDYSFANGTATSGSDFTGVNGTLNWANGDMAAKTITVPIASDTTSEGAETFTITLSNPVGGADIGRFGVNTVTIAASSSGGGGGGGGGGGSTDPLLLAGLLASLLAARRRRQR